MPRNNSGGAKSLKTAGFDATTSAATDGRVTAPITATAELIREAPAPDPFQCGWSDPSHPSAEEEPVLRTENIQGNILGGFNKDIQVLLFVELKNRRIPAFKDNGGEKPANERGGHDPIIGQNARPGEGRVREFTVTFNDDDGEDTSVRVSTDTLPDARRDWVIPTGGEYFFAPSIEGLTLLSSA
jgi:hypothetical protein